MTRRKLRRFRRQRSLVMRYEAHGPPKRMRAQFWNACDAVDNYTRRTVPDCLDNVWRRVFPAALVRAAMGLD